MFICPEYQIELLSQKNKKQLQYNPEIPLLGIYPDKIIIQKDTCTPMLREALFTIAKAWKQPKSVHQQMNG